MKNKLYRTVSVEERLPTIKGYYLTKNYGEMYFNGFLFLRKTPDGLEHNCNDAIVFWLEEVDPSTENDIFLYQAITKAFRDAAEIIHNHLKK